MGKQQALDDSADLVAPLVAGTGVIDADERRCLQTGLQDGGSFFPKASTRVQQQAQDLAFGNVDAKAVEMLAQARQRHLSTVVKLDRHAAEFPTIVALDILRHGCCDRLAVGKLPDLAADQFDFCRDDEILHQKIGIALEAGTRWRFHSDEALLHSNTRSHRPAAPLAAALRPRGFLHAAGLGRWLDVRAALQALQAGDLFPLLQNNLLQRRNLAQQSHHQSLQLSGGQTFKISGRRHPCIESQIRPRR